jgi:hypothetical protein
MPTVGAYVAKYKSSGDQVPWQAEIRCFEAETIPPGPEIAFIRFFKSGTPLPADSDSGTPAVVNYPIEAFPAVMEMLRRANHVSVGFSSPPGSFGVTVGIQRVGA